MTAKDLFDVLLRMTGVWLLILGIRDVVVAVYYFWQVSFAADVVGQYLLRATPEVLIGLFLVAGVSRIARFFIRGRNEAAPGWGLGFAATPGALASSGTGVPDLRG